jgi:hypothetical protein
MRQGMNISYKPTPLENYNVMDSHMYKLISIQ